MHRRIQQHSQCQDKGRPFLGLCLRGVTGVAHTCVAVGAMLVALGAVLGMLASARPLPMGPFVSDFIADQLEDRLAERGLGAHVDALDVSFRTGLVPVITVRDIKLRRLGEQTALVSLDAAEIVLHRGELVLGQLAPKALRLQGMQVTALSRGDDLALDLDQAPIIPAVTTPGELIQALQRLFERPALAQIEELGLEGIDLRVEDLANGWAWRSRSGDLRISRAREALNVELSLSELGDATALGNMTFRLVSDLARGTGSVNIAGRGLVPAQFLPSEGARIPTEALRVDAPVSLDLAADILPDGALGPLRGGVSVGAGTVPLSGGKEFGIEALEADLHVAHGQDHVRLSGLKLRSERLSFDGTAQLVLAETPLGVLRNAALQVTLEDVWFDPPTGLRRPLEVEHLVATLDYHRPSRRVTLGTSHVVTGGEVIELSGFLSPPAIDPTSLEGAVPVSRTSLRPEPAQKHLHSRKMLPDGWQAGLDISAESLSAETALNLWPTMIEPRVRSWVLQNVFTGDLTQAQLSMRLPPTGKPRSGLTFQFSDAAIWATHRLPALEAGDGFFSLQDRRLAVQIDQAQLPLSRTSRITLSDGLLTKSDVRQKDAPLQISGHGGASAAQVLALLEQPLFRPKDGSGGSLPLRPEDVEGQVALDLAIEVPMGPNRRAQRAQFSGRGQLRDVATDALMPGRQLRSAAMTVELSQDRVQLAGPLTVDGLPANAVWERALGPGTTGSQLTVKAPLTQALAASFGVPLRPSEMRGAGQVEAKVALQPGQAPRLALTADLTGAAFRMPGLGWQTRPESGGRVDLTGRLGDAPRFDRLRVEAPGLLAEGRLSIGKGTGLEALDFSRLRIGRWIDGPLRVRPSGGKKIAVTMPGGRVDVRYLPKGGGGENPLSTARLQGTRVVVDNDLALTDLSGTLDMQRDGAGEVTGRINGKAPVTVRLSPVDTGTRIRLRSNNAGAAAQSAGLFSQGNGGEMTLTLTPTGRAEHYLGKLRVEDITITEAPVATSLLSAISLVGLAEQIGAGGLHFGRVDAAFLLTPDRVVVSESSATGPSLGLSLDGTLDLKAKTMDMQGVLSPFYFVNRMGSGLTRRGEGLLGFTFRLNGPFKTPDVRANPLSFFTPGMFREIFRREPPKLPSAEATQ